MPLIMKVADGRHKSQLYLNESVAKRIHEILMSKAGGASSESLLIIVQNVLPSLKRFWHITERWKNLCCCTPEHCLYCC